MTTTSRRRIFFAGASGAIGSRLVPLLVDAGHTVGAMTRSSEKAGRLSGMGAQPIVCDVFDRSALTSAVRSFSPDLLLHELTDLPDDLENLVKDVADDRLRAHGRQPAGLFRRSRHSTDGVTGVNEQRYQVTTDDTRSTCEIDAHACPMGADHLVGLFGDERLICCAGFDHGSLSCGPDRRCRPAA